MSARFLISFLILAGPLAAQNVRDPVLVAEPGQLSSGPVVATWGELSAAVWVDAATGGVYLAPGDGRGVAWEAPVRVDDATAETFRQVGPGSVAVAGQAVYVWWLDQRLHPGTNDLYFNWSRDGGHTFQTADIRVDKGLPAAGNDVLLARMLVDPRRRQVPSDDVVVFLMAVHNQATGLDEAWLNWSTDGGATFQPAAVPIGGHNGFGDLDAIAGAVEDGLCWIARVDDFDSRDASNDVWVDLFDPVAASFLVSDLPVSATSSLLDVGSEVRVAARGKLVAVAWPVHNRATGGCELRVNRSLDGGTTWAGERTVTDPLATSRSLQDVRLVIGEDGVLAAAWRDDRTGRPEAWLARSPDRGATWEADLQLSVAGSRAVELVAHNAVLGAFWLEGTTAGMLRGQMSVDGGVTWSPSVDVSSADASDLALAWNRIYHSFLAAWSNDIPGPGALHAGGFRPQTLVPGGAWRMAASAGGTGGVGQVLDGVTVAWWPEHDRGGFFTVLLSGALGTTLLPDGRNLGLAEDSILTWSRNPVLGGNTGRIHADGTGDVLPLVPILEGLPSPVWAVAVGWTQSLAAPGAITDPIPLHLPQP